MRHAIVPIMSNSALYMVSIDAMEAGRSMGGKIIQGGPAGAPCQSRYTRHFARNG
jgi:hypothetical protein